MMTSDATVKGKKYSKKKKQTDLRPVQNVHKLLNSFETIKLPRSTYMLVCPNLSPSPHTLAICLCVCTSLPVWRSAAVKVRHLTNCVHVPIHPELVSLSFTSRLSRSFFYQLSVAHERFICLSCMSKSVLLLF